MCARAKKPLLKEVSPALAAELERLLRKEGDSDLAEQVSELQIVETCGCGDVVCASFYTAPHPKGTPWGPDHYTMVLEADRRAHLHIDVVDRVIVYVEVLDGDDIREELRSAGFPLEPH
jgi:hypothetical protein